MTGCGTVSVIIPAYNCAGFLRRAVDSALSQTVAPCEVIIADDGSTDDTGAVARSYGCAVDYFRIPHSGVYTVRSAALERVHGDWFLNLDADNFIESGFISASLDVLRNALAVNPKTAFAYPDRIHFRRREVYKRVPEFDVNLFKKGNFVDMNSVVSTRAAKEIGFDGSFNSGWGDYDFFLGMARAGYCGVAQHASPLHYMVRDGSITAATEKDLGRKRMLMRKIIAKHAGFFSEKEASEAVAAFSDEAVIRGMVSGMLEDGMYGSALKYFFSQLPAYPRLPFPFLRGHCQ